jgi:hypothetical protein
MAKKRKRTTTAGEKRGQAADTMRGPNAKLHRRLQGSELLVQAQINRSNAQAGGSGANVFASAMISVLVTLDGAPVDDLGATTANGTGEISLPAGWGLWGGFNVRPGGSDISVTEFGNQGDGIYDIRIVPFVRNPACVWLSGEYIYAVQIKVTRNNVVLQGGTLAKLIIP